MIARVWRGATLAEDADAYAAYLEDALAPFRAIVLHRPDGGYVEFETILFFDSVEDVSTFAGDNLDAAVFFDEDDRFLVERDLRVRHYEVGLDCAAERHGPGGPARLQNA